MILPESALVGGRVLLPGDLLVDADIGIADGHIVAIAAPGALAGAPVLVDVSGLLIMPGIIDAHIHLGHGPDITQPQVPRDTETESGAAAAGGITIFLSYLISAQPYEAELFEQVCRVTASGARTDFSFHPVISTEEQLASVPFYANEYGVPSFKVFMYNRCREGARLGLPDIDDGFLFRLAEAVARCGAVLCPHCENIEVARVLRERLIAADPNGIGGLPAWTGSRPPFVEAEAIHRVATLAREADAPLHVVHCTSAAALEAALAQRALGADLSIETCTQYLTHTIEWEGGLLAKVNPPIRERSDVEALWAALEAGKIDTVASDHVHRPAAAKSGGIWKAAPGFPGLETLLPVLLTEGYHKRGLPLGLIGRVLSENPARIMGCRSKGKIALGQDADFAFVDLEATWKADAMRMHSDAGFSIYDGWQFRGKVVHTMVRGRFVFRDEALCDDAIGFGQFVRRSRGETGGKPADGPSMPRRRRAHLRI
jgi:dihydropyrimidinase